MSSLRYLWFIKFNLVFCIFFKLTRLAIHNRSRDSRAKFVIRGAKSVVGRANPRQPFPKIASQRKIFETEAILLVCPRKSLCIHTLPNSRKKCKAGEDSMRTAP